MWKDLLSTNSSTKFAMLIMFLLPWQTVFLFGNSQIEGSKYAFGALGLYAVEVLIIVTALLLMIKKSKLDFLERALLSTFGLFVIFAISSIFTSIDKTLSFVHAFHILASFLLLRILLDKNITFEWIQRLFVLSLFIPGVFGLIQVFTGVFPSIKLLGISSRNASILGESIITSGNGERVLRAYGSFPHPNIFGGYLAVGIILSIYLAYYKNDKWRNFYIISIPSLSIFLILTFSRSAWIATLLALVLLLIPILNKRVFKFSKKKILVFVALFVISLCAFYPVIRSRIDIENTIESKSVVERIEQLREYPKIASKNLIVGSGIGTYSLSVSQTFPNRDIWEYQPIHNIYLLVIAELGLLATVFLLLSIVRLLYVLERKMEFDDYVLIISISLVLFIVGFLDHYLITFWSGISLLSASVALSIKSRKNILK